MVLSMATIFKVPSDCCRFSIAVSEFSLVFPLFDEHEQNKKQAPAKANIFMGDICFYVFKVQSKCNDT